jgi:hypothetical protein
MAHCIGRGGAENVISSHTITNKKRPRDCSRGLRSSMFLERYARTRAACFGVSCTSSQILLPWVSFSNRLPTMKVMLATAIG